MAVVVLGFEMYQAEIAIRDGIQTEKVEPKDLAAQEESQLCRTEDSDCMELKELLAKRLAKELAWCGIPALRRPKDRGFRNLANSA